MEEILRHLLDMKSLQNMSDILKINWFFGDFWTINSRDRWMASVNTR